MPAATAMRGKVFFFFFIVECFYSFIAWTGAMQGMSENYEENVSRTRMNQIFEIY